MSSDAKRMTVTVPYKGTEYVVYLTAEEARKFVVYGILATATNKTAGRTNPEQIMRDYLASIATTIKERK